MQSLKIDRKTIEKENSEREIEEEQIRIEEEAMQAFRVSPAYPYIIKSIEDKIKNVTDTRILAQSFGKIQKEAISGLGTLGVASLMASEPLEILLEELTGE